MITLCPLVYTRSPGELSRHLESRGLVTITRGERNHWFEMRGAAGGLGIHVTDSPDGPDARVELGFVTSDPQATLHSLLDAGYHDAHIWDETWARVVGVTTPEGHTLWISGDQDDFYGYHHQTTRHGTATVGVRITSHHPDRWATLLTTLGAIDHDATWEFPDHGGSITLADGDPAIQLELD